MRNVLFAVLALLAMPAAGFCSELTTAQVQSLKQIDQKIAVTHELAEHKVITPEQAAAADNLFCAEAKAIVGHDVTTQEIHTLVNNAEHTEGLGLFWNIVIVVAGILFLLGVVGLISFYLWDFLKDIPPGAYEVAAYAFTGLLAFAGYLCAPVHLGAVLVDPLWFVVPGALALAGCIFMTYKLHFPKVTGDDRVYQGPGFVSFPTVMFGLLTVAWAFLAVFYHHIYADSGIPYVLGFASVMALQAFLGFSVITMPGCIAMGWTEDRQVPKSVVSSLLVLGAYLVLKLTNTLTGDLTLFESGAVFMGAFVYYLGLLVMSSKWYCWSGKEKGKGGRYLAMQMLTIASGIAALYFGSTFHMGALLGVGGTFFAIYGLEKYYEIPWKGVGWAWSVLGVAVILYGVVSFASTHSQYFVWGIK